MLALESGERRSDPHVSTFAVVALSASLTAAMGALFGAWLSLRSGTAVWPPKGVVIQNYYGTTLSITILLGALAAGWGLYGVVKGERSQAIAGYIFLAIFGGAFVNLLTYTLRVARFGPATHPYGALVFAFGAVVGTATVVAIGMALVAVARLLGSQLSAGEPALAYSIAWYWLAVMIAWFVMYAAVYVVK